MFGLTMSSAPSAVFPPSGRPAESASSSVRKHRVRVRFYQELGDFLAPRQRGREFEVTVNDGTTTKALVEHCGVPHGEVDLPLVDGESVDFGQTLRGGQRVSLYPVFESFDISALTRVRPAPLSAVRFLVDANLAKLASLLRMCALDATDASMLCRTARRAASIWPPPCARSPAACAATSRCGRCPRPPSCTACRRWRVEQQQFSRCPRCDRLYWPGSHRQRMRRRLDTLLATTHRRG